MFAWIEIVVSDGVSGDSHTCEFPPLIRNVNPNYKPQQQPVQCCMCCEDCHIMKLTNKCFLADRGY